MRAAPPSVPLPAEWSTLLAEAVSKPGVIHDAYSRFWNYSVGNQLLAWFQCLSRNLSPGPLNTYLGWLDLKRHVKKGEKALVLCMPIACKRRKAAAQDLAADGTSSTPADDAYTRFVYRPHWFVLSQTEGEDYVPAELPRWSESLCLSALGIERIPFDHPSGNCQGYALERQVAVSPIAFAPHRTLFHELAHVVLGHTAELGSLDDHDQTPRNLREVEAEAVALLCTESLRLGSSEFSRGYIQHWLSDQQAIPEKSAQKIFKAADQILRSGRPGQEGGGHVAS